MKTEEALTLINKFKEFLDERDQLINFLITYLRDNKSATIEEAFDQLEMKFGDEVHPLQVAFEVFKVQQEAQRGAVPDNAAVSGVVQAIDPNWTWDDDAA